jgi:ABC-type uncharacterized transport system involved in gliding motility auxiliary subunit
MESSTRHTLIHAAMLVLLGIIFLSLNMCANISFRSARIDLTQNHLFTLSPGTLNVLSHIEEPMTLRFFYSRTLASNYPGIRAYAGRALDMLQEMRDRSRGKIILEVIEPEPYAESEDLAQSLGLKGAPTADGDIIYFGLVGTNLVDGMEAIPFFADERQPYLEYDVMRIVQALSQPQKPKLGIVTNLPMDTGSGGLVAAMQGQSQPFMIYEELRQRFDLEFLEPDFTKIPDEVGVLMLAHPKPLAQAALYAIDQFVMRGGRVLAFVDPHSEVSLATGASGEPVKNYTEASDLGPLLAQWGVLYDPSRIVADRGIAMQVRSSTDPRNPVSNYVLWLSVPATNLDRKDVVTASLGHLNLGTVGEFLPASGAGTRFTPLVWSSDDAALLDLAKIMEGSTPEELLRNFVPDGQRHVIAARVSGPLKSAFSAPSAEASHLASTKSDANIIVFADSDLFDDRFWVRTQGQGGERVAEPVADNARFVLSALDNLMGSDDLISLRARSRIDRPFVVVENLRRQADARFLTEQDRLQARIANAEQRLTALQAGSEGIPKDRIASETARFRADLLESRKALREVQLNLRRDIDALGTRLRVVNVILMPAIVVLAAILLLVWRRSRRSYRQSKRRAA